MLIKLLKYIILTIFKSDQIGYQIKGLTLINIFKLESSLYLILVKSYGQIYKVNFFIMTSRDIVVMHNQAVGERQKGSGTR